MVMGVSLVLKFSSGLKGLKREGKRSETISALVIPAHQKQTLTKKVGEIVRQNCHLSIQTFAELVNINEETV
jgi:DNA-binding transcriptional regulator YiaG